MVKPQKINLLFLILLFNPRHFTAQTKFELALNQKEIVTFWKADSLFNIGEYENALIYFKDCKPKNQFDLAWPIKKSLCYLLVGDTSSARNYFKNHIKNGGYYLYVDQIKQIPLYEVIAPDEVVRNQFKKNTFSFEHSDSTCRYPEFLKTLLEMREQDQAYRQGRGNPNVSVNTIDSLNQIKLDSLISIYGWLGYKEVGKSGENASFLIAQHADMNLDFQKRCLILIKKELIKGNIYPPNYALLYDRVKVNSNEAQLFGSQVELDATFNKFKPKKTRSLEFVNAYRMYFSLQSIESYLDLMNKRYEKN
jgi:tetratricopeptide (TPR) repeat protein